MNWDNWEKKHQADTKLYLQQVAAVYRSAVKEAAAIGATITQFDPSRPFSFSDYPQTKARIDKLASSLAGQIDTVVLNGIDAQWTLANNKNSVLCDRVFGDQKNKLTATQQRKYYTTNAPAREAFKARATNGLGLSDRVWKYTDQFKTEIELGLDLGLRDGLSTAEMSRDLRQYLQQPDKLFRRVRDEHGALRLSEAAKAYHPGRGVYRSSYKNALRLTSTETNIAYRTADFERWKGFDFVIGIEVKKSNNHPVHDMCDMLAGRYPKGFKFTGWHPNCRCYAVPILQEIDDFLEDKPATGQIENTPSNYNDWVGQNKDRFTSQRNTPYFMRDNKAFVKEKTIKSVRQVKTDNTKNVKNRKYRSPLKPDSLNNYPVPLDETMFDLLEKPSKVTFVRGGEFYFDRYNSVIIDRWDQRWVDSDFFKKQVIAHEFGHVIDFQHFNHANPAVTALMDKYRTAWGDNNKNGFATINSRMKNLARKLRRIEENTYLRHNTTKADVGECISSSADMLMSLNRNYGRGHTTEYFSIPENQRAEFLAHCFENYYCGNPITKKLMPDLYEDSLKLIDQIIKQIKAKQ